MRCQVCGKESEVSPCEACRDHELRRHSDTGGYTFLFVAALIAFFALIFAIIAYSELWYIFVCEMFVMVSIMALSGGLRSASEDSGRAEKKINQLNEHIARIDKELTELRNKNEEPKQ